jgi:hypothetical protein
LPTILFFASGVKYLPLIQDQAVKTVAERELVRKYYVASDTLIEFLENGTKKTFDRFASDAGVAGRTLARLRKKERISRNTADKILDAAKKTGYSGSFDGAFVEQIAEA